MKLEIMRDQFQICAKLSQELKFTDHKSLVNCNIVPSIFATCNQPNLVAVQYSTVLYTSTAPILLKQPPVARLR